MALRWPRLVRYHIPAAIWGVLVEVTGWLCPLTDWEIALRRMAGDSGYEGEFLQHYLQAIIYPAGLTRNLQFVFAGIVLVINLIVYFFVLRRKKNEPRPG